MLVLHKLCLRTCGFSALETELDVIPTSVSFCSWGGRGGLERTGSSSESQEKKDRLQAMILQELYSKTYIV